MLQTQSDFLTCRTGKNKLTVADESFKLYHKFFLIMLQTQSDFLTCRTGKNKLTVADESFKLYHKFFFNHATNPKRLP